jgi:hypothetical protein
MCLYFSELVFVFLFWDFHVWICFFKNGPVFSCSLDYDLFDLRLCDDDTCDLFSSLMQFLYCFCHVS